MHVLHGLQVIHGQYESRHPSIERSQRRGPERWVGVRDRSTFKGPAVGDQDPWYLGPMYEGRLGRFIVIVRGQSGSFGYC